MPAFAATTIDALGRQRTRIWDAADTATLRNRLRAESLWTVRIAPAQPDKRLARLTLRPRDLVALLHQLELQVRAGVTADAALINTCGQKANAVLLDWATWMKIRLSPNFRDRTKYTHLGSVPDDVIKGFFDVDFVFIGKARYNAGMEGAADSISGFWGTNAIFFVYNPSVALEDMAFGLMTLREAPFVVTSEPIPLKRGMAGQMMLVQVSTEYGLMPGFVESSSSSKYAAGYLYRTVVA